MGGAAGVLGVPLPAVETCLALSGLMLGLLMAFATKPPGCVKSVHPAVLLGAALCAGTFLAIDKNPDTLPFCALFAAGAMAMELDSAVDAGSPATVAKTLLGNWISLMVMACDIAIYVS